MHVHGKQRKLEEETFLRKCSHDLGVVRKKDDKDFLVNLCRSSHKEHRTELKEKGVESLQDAEEWYQDNAVAIKGKMLTSPVKQSSKGVKTIPVSSTGGSRI